MELLKVTQANWLNEATSYIKGGLHRLAYVVVERPVAIVHRKSQVDEDVCNALGYEIVESYNNAGTIVSNAGDILVGHFCTPDNGWLDRYVDSFLAWLRSKG